MLAAGCGTVHAGQTDTLAAAVTTTAAETSRVATTITMQMQGMTVSFTQNGLFDFAHSRGVITMAAPIGMTELFVPPKSYIMFAGNGMTLPHGKTWIEISSGLPASAAADMLGPFGGGASPADLLASLTAIAGSERKLGIGTVRGVAVTEYQVNIDPAKAAAKLPGWERAGFTQSLGKAPIPVDVWVDGQNQVRRLTMTLRMPGGKSGSPAMPPGTRLVQSTDFYDFGVTVKVSAPPAAQVVSIPQALAVGSGGIFSSSASSSSNGGISSAAPVPPVPAPASAPPVSGSLTPAQASAAEQAVAEFWAALGRHDRTAVARTVLPAQRSCMTAQLQSGPEFTVKSFRIVSAKPAGSGRATVRFTVDAQASLAGQMIPISPPGSGTQWFAAAEQAGRWYVDANTVSSVAFVLGPCP
jgi:hypothetical protein